MVINHPSLDISHISLKAIEPLINLLETLIYLSILLIKHPLYAFQNGVNGQVHFLVGDRGFGISF